MATDLWALIHPERRALLNDVAGLDDDQWNTASLCAGWTVRDTLAHLTSAAKMTPGRYIIGWVGSGFRFHAMNEKGIVAQRGVDPRGDGGSLQKPTCRDHASTRSAAGHGHRGGDSW